MNQRMKTLVYSGLTLLLTLSLIAFPDQALEAAIRGLNMWWEVVFPSLLPFFITAELLLAFGVVKFIGVLFEPIMRPLFNVPGAGSFGWIMGMASGYPTGAKITARLREENQLSKTEAERLVSFTNNSSPLFIFGAISAGFFHDLKLGLLLAVCHYTSNAIVGICMRFHGTRQERFRKQDTKRFSLKKAFQEMHRDRLKEDKPFGEILGDAVINSIKTLVMVGGFIILFSVLIKLLFLIHVTPAVAVIFQSILQILHLPVDLSLPFISGLFEITLGANMISQVTTDTLLQKAVIVSFILGFNGLSIHAQVASILAKTDIRFSPYFFARLLHGSIAVILTIILYQPLYLDRKTINLNEIPVSQLDPNSSIWMSIFYWMKDYGPMVTIISIFIATCILLYKKRKK
ncbi:sporulation integral membrane protein YlbJ [Oceanobacillus kimchii]|uniref:sporulation integral membrane protein YlbJ n=1 Tax=Oceanobacillus kimchii TaxID=746691 RepID=UPI0021A42AA2|nr:sporulation integral membrane protein YlbJ [Oceanobacillus kimchii]MCT1576383.1 sporulation integral membrane protein YlbJ [Oceanobacillus kimchii]MCT2136019.1 sporulation integral membrane protein YlbJ [Oceanobacillus kimchii]